MKRVKWLVLVLAMGLVTPVFAKKLTDEEKAMKKASRKISKDVKKNGGQSDHKTYDPNTKTVTTTEAPTQPGPNSP